MTRAEIIALAEAAAVNGELACVAAHAIATRLGVSPIEVGSAVNRASSLRFNRCQLGLFGYGPKAEGKSKIVLRAAYVPPEIEAAIRECVVESRIACSDVWALAERFGYPLLGMANIVEALGLKVAPCQLGCF